ncbi:hypothetical protein [Microbispora bryophytorum]|uniref:Enoyl reductase n=1 Tax=Microbispora bryophytorum TaxID=1460882 RepID=A0A8H9H1V5_9ACTN|nr:hypothetical protein [Microbispora bryophytorum]MBD3136125.1 hypothetical protein [Microbispora bryophytorum]TQS07869.1 hypothetical protein FLX07_08665 [Microbispora bryophytorum]GGO04614.1 hypothetical protein GCM10011574_15650 [Microbispora bryophytorum]
MRAIAVTSLLAGALLAVCAPPAAADPDVGAHGEAFQKGNTAGVKLTNSKIGLSGNGLGGKSDGYRMPRPCWYEPNSSADDMRGLQAQQKKQAVEAGLDYDVDLDRFGEKIGDKGQWWGAAYDAGNPDGASCAAGLEPLIWVPEGTAPAGGITLEQLMQIARAALTVPEPKIKLSPDAKSYVNLGTWVWLDGAEAAPRSVTATLPGVMTATVTATPDHLEIDPGTKEDDRAQVFKDCGTTGKPYVKGADKDGKGEPECGVIYRHSSVDLPGKVYTLTVTSVWTVVGNGNQGGEAVPFAYDPIQVAATRDVPVGEVQSIVKE